MKDLKHTYNKIARDWHKDHIADDWWISGTDKFISYLPKSGRVLDVGCAGGVKSRYLSDKGFQVVGIDIAPEFIDIAKREVPDATFYELDMKDVSELRDQFDGIFAQASLLHIPRNDVPDILRGFYSILKPGGHLYVAVKGAKEGMPLEELKEENDYGYPYERFFSYFTATEMQKYFSDLRLDLVWVEQTPENNTNWIQLIGHKS